MEDIRSGQKVESFALDVWDGTDWKEAARATTIGYKRLLRFPSVRAGKARLRILSTRGRAAISDLGLFLDPGRREKLAPGFTRP